MYFKIESILLFDSKHLLCHFKDHLKSSYRLKKHTYFQEKWEYNRGAGVIIT